MKNDEKTIADLTRGDFPILSQKFDNEKSIIYLDHAATSQKPIKVIEALTNYYSENNANVHRGAHELSRRATDAFEQAREITSKFINAPESKEIIFTRNATEAINLVARSWGESKLKPGDEVLLSVMEHHSNLIPWQLIAERTGCILKYVGINQDGELDIEDLKQKISKKTRLLSIVHISNTLGCCNPIKEIAKIVHNVGGLILVDACQSLAHQKIDVQDLKIDFLAGSSHKLCGPTGIGFLWAREDLLNQMPPFLGGGEMIQDVSLEKSSWADLPHKFEAGTPAIGEAIAMGKALQYLQSIGLNQIQTWERVLTKHLWGKLSDIDGVKIIGPKPKKEKSRGALATFYIPGIHANDISALLDSSGIYIRSGHHCCQPLHKLYGIKASARASLSFTSTIEEINEFAKELSSCINFLKENS